MAESTIAPRISDRPSFSGDDRVNREGSWLVRIIRREQENEKGETTKLASPAVEEVS